MAALWLIGVGRVKEHSGRPSIGTLRPLKIRAG
jgi:hypothetical protein